MKSTVAVKREPMFAQCEDMLDGLDRYEVDLDVVWVTKLILQNHLVTAEAGVRGFDEARAAKKRAVAAQSDADEAGTKFIRLARNILAAKLGENYSEAWGPTGFPNQSTAIPRPMAERQTLLRALQNYFANHSVDEVPALGITAVQAGVLFNGLSTARSTVNNAYDQMNATRVVRDNAVNALRTKMRGCIEELSQLMPDDDARWYSFGLTPPAAPETPEMVDDLELSIGGPGLVLAQWTGAPRANRYRVFKQIVGVDAEPVAVETVHDTQYAFTGLTAGQTLKVFVTAGNDAGLSDPSETMEIVVQ